MNINNGWQKKEICCQPNEIQEGRYEFTKIKSLELV